MTTRLAIVIPVRNDAARLRRCLQAIGENRLSSDARVIVIVADNGSDDDSAEVATAAGAAVLPVPGFRVGEVRNIAAGRTHAPLVAFIDADHLIDADWITTALSLFDDASVAAAGAPYSSPADANRVQRAYARLRPRLDAPQPVDWLGSGNLIVRRSVFEQVGGFDATLEACEDVDLCNRVRQAGFTLLAHPGLRSVHLGDPPSLRAVFLGELWRGRNNITVTLRGPLSVRAIVSLAIPAVNLLALALIAMSPVTGWRFGAAGAAIFAALTALRASRMTIAHEPAGWRALLDNIGVAAAYDAARALALVFRATHRTRQLPVKERAVA